MLIKINKGFRKNKKPGRIPNRKNIWPTKYRKFYSEVDLAYVSIPKTERTNVSSRCRKFGPSKVLSDKVAEKIRESKLNEVYLVFIYNFLFSC